jgi:P-type Mg2+ transporter
MIFFSNDIGASLRQRLSGSLPTNAVRPADLFWQQPTKTLLLTLRSRSEGLSAAEAARRLEETGPNAFHEPIRQRLLNKIAIRILNPLIAILLVAAAVSGLTGDAGSFAIIVAVVAGSITLDIVQEHHAVVAVETLRRSVAVRADVRRDGVVIAVPVEDLVP